MSTPGIVKAPALAKALGVTPRTVTRWCEAGVIEAFHSRSCMTWRIPLSSVEALRREGYPVDIDAVRGADGD